MDKRLIKLLCLALRNTAKKCTMPIQTWKAALNRFVIIYEDRVRIERKTKLETVEKPRAIFPPFPQPLLFNK